MTRHYPIILRDLGIVLHVPGLMALASLPVPLLAGERFAILPLLVTALAAIVPGQLLLRLYRSAPPMQLRQAMVTVILAWLVVPLVGALPFLLVAAGGQSPGTAVFAHLPNALFESMSGFTSTGLTMVEQPSRLPYTLLWWRSLSQWIGGVGVIVLMLSVFHPSGDAFRLYFAEGHPRPIQHDVISSVRTTWWIYTLYTLVAIGLLRLSGMDWWQALNFGMTGIATGGFAVSDHSLADFDTLPRLVMVVVMTTGAISFAIHYTLLVRRRPGQLWDDQVTRLLLLLIVAGALLLAAESWWYRGDAAWIDSLFQWTSALTTSGFHSTDITALSPTTLLLLGVAMCCGGAAGATTGGLKLNRVLLLAREAWARIRGIALHPWRVMEHKPIREPEPHLHATRALEVAATMTLLWFVCVSLGTLLLLHADLPAGTTVEMILLEVTSALGNVGLSSGITGPGLDLQAKVGLMLLMWLGRVEIVPALVLFAVLIGALHHHRHARHHDHASRQGRHGTSDQAKK